MKQEYLSKKLQNSPQSGLVLQGEQKITVEEEAEEIIVLKIEEANGVGQSNNQILLGLLDKIDQYKMKILNDTRFENELNLYVEARVKHSSDADSEPIEVSLGVQKYLLNPESKSRVLLLKGDAGMGKTLFCKHLQRVLISEWNFQNHEPEGRPWLPILVTFSSLKHSELTAEVSPTKVSSVSEILNQELSLNEAEIRLLKGDNSADSLLPRLLFIFDDCIEILEKSSVLDLTTPKACIKSNFYIANEFENEWGHAKVLITNRNGSLSNHTHAGLLFEPVNKSACTVIPNTFAEFLLQPFNDTQISLYLKKFVVFGTSEKFVEKKAESVLKGTDSWKSLRDYEKLIEFNGLRELIRVPMILHIFASVLSDIKMEQKDEKVCEEVTMDSKQVPKKWTRYQFYRIYSTRVINATVDRFLSSMEKGNKVQMDEQLRSLLSEKLKQQLQNIALGLSNYTFDAEEEAGAKPTRFDDIHALLPLCPLLKYDSHKVRSVTFSHKSFQEFFVASKIVEEILKCVEDSINLTRMILNQKSLVKVGVLGLIFRFLVDAIHDQTLHASVLIKLIQKSKVHDSKKPKKQSEMKAEDSQEVNIQKDHPQHNRHPLSIAAANAITILNASGYDFSRMDFSEVCIPNANLSYGVFEKTNFTGADLQGVDFSGSCLQGTTFVRANMTDVNFGVVPDLILDQEGSCIAYSSDGNSMAIGTRSQILVFEKQLVPAVHFREVRRLKGHAGRVNSCSFSKDGKYLITGGQDKTVRIWEIQSGDCLHILRGHKIGVVKCVWSRDERHIVSVDEDQKANKWSLTEKGWILAFQLNTRGATNCSFIPNYDRLLLLGNENHGFHLYTATGKYICKSSIVSKNKPISDSCVSSSGKQILIGISYGKVHIIDFIRGHILKSFKHKRGRGSKNSNLSMSSDERVVMMSTGLYCFQIQETTGEKSELANSSSGMKQSAMDPTNTNQIVLLHDQRVVFVESCYSKDKFKYCEIKQPYKERLKLLWTNIDDSIGLSDENVMIFDKRGDYEGFGKKNIQKLILNNQADELEKITKIDLSHRKLQFWSPVVIGRNTKWMNLEHLDLSYNKIVDEKAVLIANNLTWKNLQELVLNANEIADEAAAAIAGNPSWKNLRKINLSSNNIGDTGAKALGSNSHWENLEDLNLSKNEINDEGSAALGKNTSWKNLKKLNLSQNSIGNQGTISIAENPAWNYLEVLDLSFNKISGEGASALSGNTTWTNLKVLSLEKNAINHSGASKIVMNAAWINLEELYLFENAISEEPAKGLMPNQAWSKIKTMVCHVKNEVVANFLDEEFIDEVINIPSSGFDDSDAILVGKSLQWFGITRIQLEDNDIGDKGAISFGSNTTWAYLGELRLNNNYIGDKGAIAIGKNNVWRDLKRLHLNANLIGDEGAIAIGTNTTWTKLEILELNENRIGDKGAVALGQNTAWSSLKTLNLDRNNIGDEGGISIGLNTSWVHLERLYLQENAISDRGAVAIGSNRNWIELKQLVLSANNIGDEGAISIGANTTWIILETLDLHENKIGDEGAIAIGSNTAWFDLERLDLQANAIGNEGAIAIGKNVTWSNLEKLSLAANRIRDEGVIAIGSNTTWNCLSNLRLSENEIGNKGAISLASNTTWRNLKELDLNTNQIGDEGIIALREGTAWPNLQMLYLFNNKFNAEDQTICDFSKENWKNLETFIASISPALQKVLDLIESSKDHMMTQIELGSKGLTVKDTMILECKLPSSIAVLDLSNNNIGDTGASIIGVIKSWRNLKKLDLSSNQISDEGAGVIGRNETWKNLQELVLSHNRIGNKGAITISRNYFFRNLIKLDLSANELGDEAAFMIGKNKRWIQLEELLLSENEIGDQGATLLAQNMAWKKLIRFEIHLNQYITETGKKTLQSNPIFGSFVSV